MTELSSTFVLLILFYRLTLLMGGGKDPYKQYISCYTRWRHIFNGYSTFSLTAIPMELLVILPDTTGYGKSKMAACKLERRISIGIHKIATKFQRLYLCFRVQLSNGNSGVVVRLRYEQCRLSGRRLGFALSADVRQFQP